MEKNEPDEVCVTRNSSGSNPSPGQIERSWGIEFGYQRAIAQKPEAIGALRVRKALPLISVWLASTLPRSQLF